MTDLALAEAVQLLALTRAITIAVAESCTGGLLGHSITEVPGSSGYFLGGVISYADEAKHDLLHVPAATIERHGAVSAQTAVAMARGVRERFEATLGLSTTGIAGPGGGSQAKPVGLTYVAIASAGAHDVRRFLWQGDRHANKQQSVTAALNLLLEWLEHPP
ncbi:MAG: CinA family protein [Chloroflexi bacterium]|nr:CinA family protein [Chloroflexota bacterium]